MATPLQVLIVEDRARDADLMVAELKNAGFAPDWQRVETEHDFRVRLTPTVDVILCDHSLPQFNAPRALAILKDARHAIPLIVISGSLDDQAAVACLKLGAADYLLKDRLARLGPAVRRSIEEAENHKEIQRGQEALRRSEAQLRGILSTVEDVVWSFSLKDGKLVYLNPAAEKLTGRSLDSFFQAPDTWIEIIHPDDHVSMLQVRDEAVRWGVFERECRILRADGMVRTCVMRAWANHDESGRPIRLEGIFTDVTDKREADERRQALEKAKAESERLRALSEFKSRLISMVAHDLNNLIAPIKINLELVSSADPTAAGPAKKAKERLESNVANLSLFLADLLDAARLQAGHIVLRKERALLSGTIEKFANAQTPIAASRGIEIGMSIEPDVHAEIDVRRIEQVMTNLVSNALKFTPVRGMITISVQSDDRGHAIIRVQDSGVGIDPADIPHLFQPFSQLGAQAQGAHTGTGLGLFICRGIVEQHGGRIWAESQGRGRGAAFVVQLAMAPKINA
jgi:PAS domain S-box-containing protein